MFFTNSNLNNRFAPNFAFSGKEIEIVKFFNYLGINLDMRLKYTDHVRTLEVKLRSLTGITFYKAKSFNFNAAKLFYNSFVFSALLYEIIIWGGTLQVHSLPNIRNLQDRIVKNLFRHRFPSDSVNELYIRLNILKVADIYRLELMKFFFGIKDNDRLLDKFNLKRNQGARTNRETPEFIIPFPRVDTVKCNMHYQIPYVWNEIPQNIRSISSLPLFIRKLKEHYLNGYSETT